MKCSNLLWLFFLGVGETGSVERRGNRCWVSWSCREARGSVGSRGAEYTRRATVWDLEAVGVPSALEALEGQHGVLACPAGLGPQRSFGVGGRAPHRVTF